MKSAQKQWTRHGIINISVNGIFVSMGYVSHHSTIVKCYIQNSKQWTEIKHFTPTNNLAEKNIVKCIESKTFPHQRTKCLHVGAILRT